MIAQYRKYVGPLAIYLLAIALISGCGLFSGSSFGPDPTETPEPRTLVPTFTPTTVGQQAAEPQPVEPQPVAQEPESSPDDAAEAESTPEPIEEAPVDTPTPETPPTEPPPPPAQLSVSADIVNVRQGPGTTYGLVGSAEQGAQLSIIGKNEQGDWWQICCVNGEPGWVFSQLVDAQNTEGVEVAANIPAAPAPPPPPPTDTPAPPPPEEPPQAQGDPDAGPCGGDDGCKFRIAGGPTTGGNGGMELKLQFIFLHSGVEGGQPQGSYFVVLKKDGARLPVPDSVRSVAKDKSQGQLGEYNYEYSMGTGDLPGNNVAGNYTVWVLDGNGERDSDIFNFSVPEGQGLVWIKFDQG